MKLLYLLDSFHPLQRTVLRLQEMSKQSVTRAGIEASHPQMAWFFATDLP
jgi:hypothetical protein